jgi:acetyl-CoA acetyltransferase
MVYEQVGFAAPGEGPELLASGRTRLGGAMPVNTSGGLVSKGHPIAPPASPRSARRPGSCAAKPARCQVEGAEVALTQNGGGRLEGDSAAMSVHILSAD